MRLRCTIFTAAGLLLFAAAPTTVLGLTYTFDFSEMGFSSGQNMEGYAFGVAITTSEDGKLYYDAYHGGGLHCGYGATGDIYIDFLEPIDYISVTAGDGGGDSDAFSLYLYDFSSGNLIGRWDSPLFDGSSGILYYTLEVSVPSSKIGRVVFDPGNSGRLPGTLGPPTGGGVIITELSYNTVDMNPVPEPSTMLLLGSGLAGLLGCRRRSIRRG